MTKSKYSIQIREYPLLFSISALGSFTNGFTFHPKDEAMVKCLANKDTSVTVGR